MADESRFFTQFLSPTVELRAVRAMLTYLGGENVAGRAPLLHAQGDGDTPATPPTGGTVTTKFKLPSDLFFNTAKIADPAAYARQTGAASWLYLNGEEFGSMEGGMSYRQVQEAVAHSKNVISDPPRVLNLELAKQHVEALDELPRPTLVSCRAGPRASAVAFMYAGLEAGADPDEVIEAARAAGAPFTSHADYVEWVKSSILALRRTTT
jgi:hypothetical protein